MVVKCYQFVFCILSNDVMLTFHDFGFIQSLSTFCSIIYVFAILVFADVC